MPRRSKGSEPINLVFVVIGLYVLGYINPDTREAFFWAGVIVGALVLLAGLLWIIDRSGKQKTEAATVEAQSAAAEQRRSAVENELEEVLD